MTCVSNPRGSFLGCAAKPTQLPSCAERALHRYRDVVPVTLIHQPLCHWSCRTSGFIVEPALAKGHFNVYTQGYLLMFTVFGMDEVKRRVDAWLAE
jgi:hypothetical protein